MLSPLTFATVVGVSLLAGATDADRIDWAHSFATKTPYWDQTQGNAGRLQHERASDYTLVQVQEVIRHGTRYPTAGNIGEINTLIAKLQTNYSSAIPSWLQSYQLPYNISVEGLLAAPGYKELEDLGTRLRAELQSAVPEAYSTERFVLSHTNKVRTKQTAQAFARTFFSNPSEVKYIENPKKYDPLLRFYDQCPRYQRDIKDNAKELAEYNAFLTSKKADKTIRDLEQRLRLRGKGALTIEDVQAAYSACAFDLALYRERDAWCSLMTSDLVEYIEYAEDLETFYQESFGNKLNYEMAAVLLQDVYRNMVDFISGKSKITGNFRFAHGETTMPLMTLLGYVDRERLTAAYRDDAIAQRKFRASRWAPFMANVGFRLYTKPSKTGAVEYFVQIRVNERVAPVPGCAGRVFCKLGDFERAFGYYLTQYDFVKDCA